MAQFQFTEAEFVRATFILSRRRLAWMSILAVVAFGLIAVSLALKPEHSLGEAIVICGAGCAILLAFLFFGVRSRAKKIFREQPILQAPLTVTIDEEQLAYTWERGSYFLPWAKVKTRAETPEFFFVYESPSSARIIPRRALSDAETAIIRRKAGNENASN